MGRRRIRSVAVLLAMVVIAQAVAVAARRGDGAAPAGNALAPGTEPVLSGVLLTEGRVLRAAVSRDALSPPAHAVYGESGRDDPLTGRMLVIGSAVGDAGAVVPTSETPGFRLVELGDRSAAVGHDRSWAWVTWNLPGCTGVCQGYAASRGLSEDELVIAARAATVTGSNPTVAGTALPAGLTLLLTARLDLKSFDAPRAQAVAWVWEGAFVGFVVVPDAGLSLLLRFWVDGGPADVRDRPGSAGELARVGYGGDVVARAWSEGGRSLLMISNRLSFEDFDRFLAGVRVAGAGEWEALRHRVLEVSSDALIDGCRAVGGSFTAVGRQEGRYRWAVGFRPGLQNQVGSCHVILTPDQSSVSSLGSPRPAARALSVATSGVGGATDPAGLFVVGVAPAGTARVRVDVAGGGQLDAELAAVGPAPGERYYAAFVEGAVRVRPAVVALNGAGAEIARAAGGAPA